MVNFLKKSFYINFFIVTSIFILDRVTKIYVINFYDNNLGDDLLNSKYLNIRLIWNEGIAFGLFSFDEKILYNILTFLIGLVIFIIFFMLRTNEGLKKYSLLIILGGAIGNLIDRGFTLFNLFEYKGVIDFIDLGITGIYRWPYIFNVADMSVTFGIIIFIISTYLHNNQEVNNDEVN